MILSATSGVLSIALARYLRYDLRKHFRHVSLVGQQPSLSPGWPVVLYANHHNFYDGHLAWLFHETYLSGNPIVWMREWDRIPLFSPLGTHPFPADEPARRLSTIRKTARRMQSGACSTLIYFPEGKLHPPENGITSWSAQTSKLFDILRPAIWLPLAIHVTWRDHPKPVVYLSAGEPSKDSPKHLRKNLVEVWQNVRSKIHPNAAPLLESGTSASQRFDLSFTRSIFRRFL